MESTFSGLRVIECGSFISAAYCAKLLGDLGAEVVKVEPPEGGDEARAHGPFLNDLPHAERSGLFLYLNTSKLGITLNLETPTGQTLLGGLLQDADILVSNYRPQDLARLGLDPDTLCATYPRLIFAAISPFGLSGPNREYRAYDINLCGASGLSVGVGEPDRAPLTLPLYQAEYQAGLSAMGATVAALLARELTGEGQVIDISNQDVLFSFFSGVSFAAYVSRGVSTTRLGDRVAGPYMNGCLPCADGYVGLRTPQRDQWLRFIELIDGEDAKMQASHREIQRDGQPVQAEVETRVSEWLLCHTKEQVFELCRNARVPCAPVMDAADITRDNHLRSRGYFVDLERLQVGRLTYPGAPVRFSESLWRASRPAPLLGEHNAEIYGNRLGLSGEELVRLQRAGTI